MADLAKMRPAFKKDALSPQVTPLGSMMVRPSSFWPIGNKRKDGHKPIARLVSYALAGVPNHIMGERFPQVNVRSQTRV